MVEQFFKDHQYTVAALGAISTLLAVIISLWLAIGAMGANRSKLKARTTITTLVPPGVNRANAPQFVTAEIVNTGALPLRLGLSYFRLRLPFQRGSTMFVPQDSFANQLMPQRRYPVEVMPNSSISLFVSELGQLLKSLTEMKSGMGWFDRLRFRAFRFCVLTDDGRWFRVKIDTVLREALATSGV